MFQNLGISKAYLHHSCSEWVVSVFLCLLAIQNVDWNIPGREYSRAGVVSVVLSRCFRQFPSPLTNGLSGWG